MNRTEEGDIGPLFRRKRVIPRAAPRALSEADPQVLSQADPQVVSEADPQVLSRARTFARIEDLILNLAARQHGVVSRRQLLDAGASPATIDRCVKREWLRALHRGVFLVPPLRSSMMREMAATLACEGAVISHVSATVMRGMVRKSDAHAPVHLIIPHGGFTRRPGIRAHRVRTLQRDEWTTLDGIPTTVPVRTLYDIASVVGARELEDALAVALDRGLASRAAILAQAARHTGRPGVSRLCALLEREACPVLTRSAAEERFSTLIGKGGLPRPRTNVEVSGFEVDFLWKHEGLVVEVDGFRFHSTRQMFESDRLRDAVLVSQGLRVIRVTWRQLVNEPEALIVRLTRALSPSASAYAHETPKPGGAPEWGSA